LRSDNGPSVENFQVESRLDFRKIWLKFRANNVGNTYSRIQDEK